MGTLRDFCDDPAMRVGVEAALNLAYLDDPYRPDINEIVGSALAIAADGIREQAEEIDSCNKHDDCTAKAAVLARLADWLEQAS